MKPFFLLFILFAIAVTASAQFTVRIIVNDVATKKYDDIYVAGDFNNWNPHDDNYKMKLFGATRKLYVFKDVAASKFSFKFTRGTWDKVETTAKGEDVENHEVAIDADTTLTFFIGGWKDDFPDKPKPNTSSAQVQVIDTAFFMPQLNRSRRIWIYLPKNYNLLKSKYFPVLYMHDGQNLFNEQTAFSGEWGVDECLDTLQRQLNKDCIVVGIDNGGDKRMNEYNPYDDKKFGPGEGDKYMEFIVQALKPFIDSRFRTQKDRQHTAIAGSSMGGLISMYALKKYPDIFGYAGVFSPSFWIALPLYTDLQNTKWKDIHTVFFYAGKKESDDMVPDMQQVETLLNSTKMFNTTELVFPLGQHKEEYWRKAFATFYLKVFQ
ncbi:alpha/beta hydrolase-fold protein [soil metagenome]